MPDFRVRASALFVTYPDADFDNQLLLDFLKDKFHRQSVNYIVVCREYHKYPEGHELEGQEDESRPHHHALIILQRRCDIKNSRFLDFNEKHPNIQPAPKPNATLTDARTYIIKDGLFVEDGEFVDGKSSKRKSQDDVYEEALNEATAEGFLSVLETKAPRDFVIMHDKITAMAAKRYKKDKPDFESRYSIEDFNLPTAITDWYAYNFMVSA